MRTSGVEGSIAFDHGEAIRTVGDALRESRTIELLAPEIDQPPCWVEDRDRGAGAVPTDIVEHVSTWVASHGSGAPR